MINVFKVISSFDFLFTFSGEKLDYPRFPPFTNLAFFPASYHGNGAVLAGPGVSFLILCRKFDSVFLLLSCLSHIAQSNNISSVSSCIESNCSMKGTKCILKSVFMDELKLQNCQLKNVASLKSDILYVQVSGEL